MFRALPANLQGALHKRHLVYCARVMSVGCKVKVKVPVTDPKAQRGVEVYLYSFLTSALEGGGW
jgi:hypothetical protein